MNQPVVFMSKDFFVSFCKELSKPYDKIPISKQVIVYLDTLIFQKAKVYIDLDETEISDINTMQPKDIMSESDEHRRILLGQLKKLLDSGNKVPSCRNELNIFRSKNYSDFDKLKIKPHFIFLADSREFCKEIETEFGIICISKDLEIWEENTRVNIKTIHPSKDKPPTNIPVDFLASKLPCSHCVIIEDPHLFDDDKSGIFLQQFLKSLLKDGLKVNAVVTLIFDNGKGINVDKVISKINENTKFKIEYFVRSTQYIHERIVYSNSFYLTCGYGFKSQYSKTTEWSIQPIGIYFSQYSERKNASSRFVKNEKNGSINYLMQ